MADDIRSMPAQLRKVDGGYELFIPDDYAEAVGIAPGVVADLELMGDMLWVRQHQFIEQRRAERWANFDPSQLHDPHEPYPLPPDMEPPTR
jgi:bifunctional DNA-binding transcriptional regulator/antitoxin component of YhaV-PrlF toxin-antitoxin module